MKALPFPFLLLCGAIGALVLLIITGPWAALQYLLFVAAGACMQEAAYWFFNSNTPNKK